jgi:hypothetical protein
LESFRALKLSSLEKFRALKSYDQFGVFSGLKIFIFGKFLKIRALKFSRLEYFLPLKY